MNATHPQRALRHPTLRLSHSPPSPPTPTHIVPLVLVEIQTVGAAWVAPDGDLPQVAEEVAVQIGAPEARWAGRGCGHVSGVTGWHCTRRRGGIWGSAGCSHMPARGAGGVAHSRAPAAGARATLVRQAGGRRRLPRRAPHPDRPPPPTPPGACTRSRPLLALADGLVPYLPRAALAAEALAVGRVDALGAVCGVWELVPAARGLRLEGAVLGGGGQGNGRGGGGTVCWGGGRAGDGVRAPPRRVDRRSRYPWGVGRPHGR